MKNIILYIKENSHYKVEIEKGKLFFLFISHAFALFLPLFLPFFGPFLFGFKSSIKKQKLGKKKGNSMKSKTLQYISIRNPHQR